MFYEKDFIGFCLQFVRFRDGFGSRENAGDYGWEMAEFLYQRDLRLEFFAIHVGDSSFRRTVRYGIYNCAAAGGIDTPGLAIGI